MTRFLIERKRLLVGVLALSVLAGLLATWLNVGTDLQKLRIAAATTHVMIDSPEPSIVRRRAVQVDIDALTLRAELLAPMMATPVVVDRIAARAAIPSDEIGAVSTLTGDLPNTLTEPDSEKRAAEIGLSDYRYKLDFEARPQTPIVDVYSQAPSVPEAKRLADGAVAGLRDHLRDLAAQQGFRNPEPVRLIQLSPARGGVVNSMAPIAIIVLSFATGFAATLGLVLFLIGLHIRRTAPRQSPRDDESSDVPSSDDWPHTTRLLPWTFAAFVAVLWIMPINEIQLSFSLPIDLKLDRLVLPFVAIAWLLALIAGGRLAPRLRFSPIHYAVSLFVLCAFVSVVVDARYLNQTLELDRSLKRLPLLVSYVSLFFIAATAVRRTEVRAFLKYTLALAVITALGMIWEYRLQSNPFYELSHAFLPGIFTVEAFDATGVDNIGRRIVRGPATVPLEAVAMLAMALPIAVVFIMQAKERRTRVLGSLATCLLLAATFATFRKTALLLPISVLGTLIYFRGRQLLKFAPLGLVVIAVVRVLAPGALGSTSSQLEAGRLNVPTVSDRAIDYDAVRPDIWSHLLLGRGWGTYDHNDYRILDSEILQRLIEMGVVGLITFCAMGLAVVYATRLLIRRWDETWSPLALIGAASTIAFLVASCLFDVLSFPHATYIFLYMAGLTAVVVAPPRRPPEEPGALRRDASHAGRVRVRPPGAEALTRAPAGRGSARR